ncbi:MAG: GT-D fold domain-containing glycosyltransferase [Firmicutes bacterium]|nr:GT-D fold domain-containing glycosyltransferase [Bacillota bacterium]
MYTFNINSAAELLEIIAQHCGLKKPFSLVRIGDGENFILAQEPIHTARELIEMYNVVADYSYSGIAIPNTEARDRLLGAVRRATVLGFLSQTECYCWYPMTEKIFDHYGIKPKKSCYAFINLELVTLPHFYDLFRRIRILLIGKPMTKLAEVLIRRYRFSNIVGLLNLRDYRDLDIVLEQMPRYNFEAAFIAAGANAKIVAAAAMDMGRMGLDLGHAVDRIIAWDEQNRFAWDDPNNPPGLFSKRTNPLA